MTTPNQYIKQVKQEFSKVSWPTKSNAMLSTLIVIVLSLILSGGVAGADFALSKIVQFIISFGG